MGIGNKSLEEILLEMKAIDMNTLTKANEIKEVSKKPIDTILLEMNVVDPSDIMKAKATQMGVEYVDVDSIPTVDKNIIDTVSANLITRYFIVPFEMNENELSIAMHDPDDIYTIDDIRLSTGLNIKPFFAEKEKILLWIDEYIHGKKVERKAAPKAEQVKDEEIEININKNKDDLAQDISFEDLMSQNEDIMSKELEENKRPSIETFKSEIQSKKPGSNDDFGDFLEEFMTTVEPDDQAQNKNTNFESQNESSVDKFFQDKSNQIPEDEDIKIEDFVFNNSNDSLDTDVKVEDFSFESPKENEENMSINFEKNAKENEDSSDNDFVEQNLTGNEQKLEISEIAMEDDKLMGNDSLMLNNEEVEIEEVEINDKYAEFGGLDYADDGMSDSQVSNFDLNVDQAPMFKVRIGDYLLANHTITQQQLEDALAMHKQTGEFLGKVLVKKGFIKRRFLFEFLEKQMGVKYIDLDDVELKPDVIALVPDNIAKMYNLIPYEKEENILRVAMADPLNMFAIEDLRFASNMEIQPMLADDEQIKGYIDTHYEAMKNSTEFFRKKKEIDTIDQEFKKVNEEILVEHIDDELEELDDPNVEDAPIVKLVNIIFQGAVARKASDIHLEPRPESLTVRYRVDGELVEVMNQDKKITNSLVARIKIISGLNIAEKRLPQDGRITINIGNKPYDLRVSVLPTMFGEKVVIRIADKEGFNVKKTQLGFYDDDLEKFEDILSNPHGIVLVTGPTGSGKSTTLYTALRELSKPNVNILTVEDPVEATIKGINQVQVNPKAGLDFALSLRAFLRQDPDIIMVGEIRDQETAEIAVRAAITGHLVLSTLHTNDAPSCITRIIDMGVEPYLIASALVGAIAQRLVRRLCNNCKAAKPLELSDKKLLNIADDEEVTIYEPVGCDECNGGYSGRIAVHEVMELDRELRDLIAQNVSPGQIKDLAVKNGMRTISDNCIRLIKDGVTSIEEMMSVSTLGE